MLDLENSQVGDSLQDQYELVETLNVADIEDLDHVIMSPVGFMKTTWSVFSSVKRS